MIAKAKRDYQLDEGLQRVTSEDAVVNLALKEAGHKGIIQPGA